MDRGSEWCGDCGQKLKHHSYQLVTPLDVLTSTTGKGLFQFINAICYAMLPYVVVHWRTTLTNEVPADNLSDHKDVKLFRCISITYYIRLPSRVRHDIYAMTVDVIWLLMQTAVLLQARRHPSWLHALSQETFEVPNNCTPVKRSAIRQSKA